MNSVEIRGSVVLPARRQDITLQTSDGLRLVGELALPPARPALATLITLHPLPTAGGFMDSHIIRKAAARLPALADIAVLRFNTRGTSSPRGTSQGSFDAGRSEAYDLQAAFAFVRELSLPNIWLLGWSFGTELVLKYGLRYADLAGAILLSPPLRRVDDSDLLAWSRVRIPVLALIPELDDYLPPDLARPRFAIAPNIQLIEARGARHLWVGEKQTLTVLNAIAKAINPRALPLPQTWSELG